MKDITVDTLRSGAWDSVAWREQRDAKFFEWLQNADAARFGNLPLTIQVV